MKLLISLLLMTALAAPWTHRALTAPTLSLQIYNSTGSISTVFTDEVFVADARLSTGISNIPQTNGTPSVTIDFGDGFTTNLMAGGHSYMNPGSYTITLTGKASNGDTSTTSTNITVVDVTAEVTPAHLTDSGNVATNTTNLQNAIIAAAAANSTTQDILLDGNWPGDDFNSIVLTRPTGGTAYIRIIWTGLTVARNSRVAPADMTNAPTFVSQASTDPGSWAMSTPMPAAANPSHHYRLIGLEFKKNDARYRTAELVGLGDHNVGQDVYSEQPLYFLVDRCYFNGGADSEMFTATVSSPTSTSMVLNSTTGLTVGTYVTIAYNSGTSYVSVAIETLNTTTGFVTFSHDVAFNPAPTPTNGTTAKWGGTSNTGLRVAADYVTVKDSYFAGFKTIVGIDPCAIAISKGKGPHAIWNNFLEGSGENFFIGGSDNGFGNQSATISAATTTTATFSSVTDLEVDMSIALPVGGLTAYGPMQSTVVRAISGLNVTFDAIPTAPFNTGTAKWCLTPSFLEFRRNYVMKPSRWRHSRPDWPTVVTAADYNGTDWMIKNLWETKNLRYGVIDGNVFEDTWVADQANAIVISPRNVNGYFHPAATAREIQFSNNILHKAGNGIVFQDDPNTPGSPSQIVQGFTVFNNLFRNVGEGWQPTQGGPYRQFFRPLAGGSTRQSERIHFIHNTFDSGAYTGTGASVTYFGNAADGSGIVGGLFLNNAFPGLAGFPSNVGGQTAAQNIAAFMPPGTAASWNKNLVVNMNGVTYPAGAINLTATWTTGVFVNHATGDFTLVPGSPGKNAALDGTDVGVNMVTLTAATQGYESGNWASGPPVGRGKVTISGSVTISP